VYKLLYCTFILFNCETVDWTSPYSARVRNYRWLRT